MSRTLVWTTHEEAAAAEREWWAARTVEERVSAVEVIRRATPGVYGDAPTRLERVLRIADAPSNKRASGRAKDLLDIELLMEGEGDA